LEPALAISGKALVVMVTLETEAAHGELLIDQVKTVIPAVNPVSVEEGDNELVIIPEPDTLIHTPVPVAGALPARVVEPVLTQTVWFVPAFEMEGGAIPVIVTLAEDGAHGLFEIVHRKTFGPIPSPVMVVLGRAGLVIVPLPRITLQIPVPDTGVFAAIVAPDETQTV
jgi:hypothetical protein